MDALFLALSFSFLLFRNMTAIKSMSFDEALVGRVHMMPDDEVFHSISPLKHMREQGCIAPLGAWWVTPEAIAAEAQLAEAARSLPAPLSADGIVHDLLPFTTLHGGPATMHVRRRVALSDAAEPHDGLSMPIPRADESWEERCNDSEPSVLVLKHRFRLNDGRELTLRTLLFSGCNVTMPPEVYSCVAFGTVPVAVQPHWGASDKRKKLAATAVALDGSWLTAAQLGLLPKAVRDELDSCRAAQRVATSRSVLRHRWPGAFGMMRVSVAPVLGHAACAAMQNLAASLCLARAGGNETYQLMHIRTWHAECLEAQGHWREASGQYMLNLASQANWGCQDDPSDAWANLGLALTQMGDYPAAIHAFRRALEANDVVARHNDMQDLGLVIWFGTRRDRTAADRESQRLRLHEMEFVTALRMEEQGLDLPPGEEPLVVHGGQVPISSEAIGALFHRYFIQGVDTEPTEVQANMSVSYSHAPGGLLRVTSLHSGANFVLRKRYLPNTFKQTFWVERLPPGSPLPPEAVDRLDPRAEDVRRSFKSQEGFNAHVRTRTARLPRLPPKACARCGTVARNLKLCGGCGQVAFCGQE